MSAYGRTKCLCVKSSRGAVCGVTRNLGAKAQLGDFLSPTQQGKARILPATQVTLAISLVLGLESKVQEW